MSPQRDDIHKTPGNGDGGGPVNLNDSRDLLVRVYERQRAENDRIDQMYTEQTKGFASIDARFDTLDAKYVSQVEFWPVKMIVYVGAGTILLAVLSALVAMVVINREAIRAVRTERANHGYRYAGGFLP